MSYSVTGLGETTDAGKCIGAGYFYYDGQGSIPQGCYSEVSVATDDECLNKGGYIIPGIPGKCQLMTLASARAGYGAAVPSAHSNTDPGAGIVDWLKSVYTAASTSVPTAAGQPARTHCGQSGQAVKDWQTFLASKGLNVGTIDGIHGNGTEKASQQFEGKPQTGCSVSGGYTSPPPSTTPPVTPLTPPKQPGTLMGMSKSAMYVGVGSLALLGVAVVVSHRRKAKAA